MTAQQSVVYDACVLHSAALRDLLVRLAMTGLFRARWTSAIHEEWMRSVLAARPDLTRARLARTRRLMDASVPDCLVEGYEALVAELGLPDPDDRHVLAAAIRAEAEVIVTYNVADFPGEVLSRHGIEAQHPDAFVSRLIGLHRGAVIAAVGDHRASLRRPPKSVDQYLSTLERQGLTQTVGALRHHADLI